MSDKKSDNKRQKFRPPFKREQTDDKSCETSQQKRNKTKVEKSAENSGHKTEDNSLKVGKHSKPIETKEDKTEDTLEMPAKGKDAQNAEVLVKKSTDFVFLSAKGEEWVINKKVIHEVSNKFNSLVKEEEFIKEDTNQLVPEVKVNVDNSLVESKCFDQQIVKDMINSDEFVAEWEEWADDF